MRPMRARRQRRRGRPLSERRRDAVPVEPSRRRAEATPAWSADRAARCPTSGRCHRRQPAGRGERVRCSRGARLGARRPRFLAAGGRPRARWRRSSKIRSRTTLPAIVGARRPPRRGDRGGAAFDDPAQALRLVAVTGTNGKTTTVDILRHLLDGPGARAPRSARSACCVGSDGVPLRGRRAAASPRRGRWSCSARCARSSSAGVRTVAMEAVVAQPRPTARRDGLVFESAIFTNLTRDHLDYHEHHGGVLRRQGAARCRYLGRAAWRS